MTWTMGRQLASFDDITYTYNEEGIRTSKTSNGVTTKYYLNGTNIIEQTDGTKVIRFIYGLGLKKWKSWLTYGLKNYTAVFANKLGKESVKGYYFNRNGRNYAIYIFTSGPYKELIASVVELTENQMKKFGLR